MRRLRAGLFLALLLGVVPPLKADILCERSMNRILFCPAFSGKLLIWDNQAKKWRRAGGR